MEALAVLPFVAALGLVVLTVACGAAGSRLAQRAAPNGAETGFAIAQGGLITLTSLLLGFTFGFAASRYDLRRELVVREANAIGTAALRAELLDAADAARIRASLPAYVATRLRAYRAHAEPERAAALAESERLGGTMWSAARDAARGNRPAPIVVSVASALNEMFDAGAAELDAYANRTPLPVVVLLFVAVPLAGAAIGLGFARLQGGSTLLLVTFACTASLTVFAILDFDDPHSGLIGNELASIDALQRIAP